MDAIDLQTGDLDGDDSLQHQLQGHLGPQGNLGKIDNIDGERENNIGDLHIVGEESLHSDNFPGLDHNGEGRDGQLVDVSRLGTPLW